MRSGLISFCAGIIGTSFLCGMDMPPESHSSSVSLTSSTVAPKTMIGDKSIESEPTASPATLERQKKTQARAAPAYFELCMKAILKTFHGAGNLWLKRFSALAAVLKKLDLDTLRDEDGRNIVHYVMEKSFVPGISQTARLFLLQAIIAALHDKRTLMSPDETGNTPLNVAAQYADPAGIKILLYPMSPEEQQKAMCVKNMLGFSPLLQAARLNRDPDVVQLLLDFATDKKKALHEADYFGRKILLLASENDNPAVLRFLLGQMTAYSVNVSLRDGLKLLSWAAEYNKNKAAVNFLAKWLKDRYGYVVSKEALEVMCRFNKDMYAAFSQAASWAGHAYDCKECSSCSGLFASSSSSSSSGGSSCSNSSRVSLISAVSKSTEKTSMTDR